MIVQSTIDLVVEYETTTIADAISQIGYVLKYDLKGLTPNYSGNVRLKEADVQVRELIGITSLTPVTEKEPIIDVPPSPESAKPRWSDEAPEDLPF